MSTKWDIVQSKINVILDNNSKAKVLYVYKNKIFPFIYDIKNTIPSKFLDSSLYNVSNFWLEIKVIIELQIHSCNFKIKGKKKNMRCFFKFIGFYKLQKVKILSLSMLEKKQKEINKFIATLFKTKNIQSVMNLLEWIIDKNIRK